MDAGLHLAPSQRSVAITNRPVLDVNFSQFRAKVSGTITCMGENFDSGEIAGRPESSGRNNRPSAL